MSNSKQKLIVIVGSTAAGKTDLAFAIAKEIGGEVISADSRTIYRGMDIGTAKPKGRKAAAAELTPDMVEKKGIHGARQSLSIKSMFTEKPYMVDGVPHWGIDIRNPDEAFTAADFKAYAEKKLEEIRTRGNTPILAGGTGLYVNAVVNNLTLTDVAPDKALRESFGKLSNNELLERIREIDSQTAETIDAQNRRRLVRALEVVTLTGEPLSKRQQKGEQKYDVLMIGVVVDREELHERINERVERMVAEGLVDEVRGLKEAYGCEVNAMTGIGYRQVCAFLEGQMKLKDAVDVIKRDTRHYAKRQMTWFKRDERIKWVKNKQETMRLVEEFLG